MVYTKREIVTATIFVAVFSSYYSRLYPVLFCIVALLILTSSKRVLRTGWLLWLAVYVVYAVCTYLRNPNLAEGSTLNIVKLVLNSTFLAQITLWFGTVPESRSLVALDRTVVLCMVLTCIQLLVYHLATGLQYLHTSTSSDLAGMLFQERYAFFGPADKNVFGAKLALFGFLFILIGWLRTARLPTLRMFVVMVAAYASLSRTPLAALAAGLLVLAMVQRGRRRYKVLIAAGACAALPYFFQSLIRIGSFGEMNDGFGIRLIYWLTFFQNLHHISAWGNGFLSAKVFLQQYAPFYNGEPQMHNVLLNNYLDFGVLGSISFLLFLTLFIRSGYRVLPSWRFWLVGLTPVLGTMLTLFTGYESDFVVYLGLLYCLAWIVRQDGLPLSRDIWASVAKACPPTFRKAAE